MIGELAQLRRKVDTCLANRKAASVMLASAEDTVDAAQAEEHAIREATALVQTVATAVQEEAHNKIADIVSHALEAVFDEPYTFKINFEKKRGRTEASLTFTRNGNEVDPMTASGGGVVDVAAFALRLSCIMLSRPPVRRLLVLDEPWKFLSADRRPRLRALVETLADKMDCQFVIVTHDDMYRMGTIISL